MRVRARAQGTLSARLFDDVLDTASDDDFDYVVHQLGELAVSTGLFPTSPFDGMREDA